MSYRELVLIIDDEKEHVIKLSKCFAQFNLDTVTAKNGTIGKKFCIELQPNIIISEVDLPDISGFDLCREMQVHKKTADIPFVFTTWRDQEIDRVVGFELGATDYVVKPIVPKEVALRTVGILRRLRGFDGKRLIRMGRVVIDLEQSLVIDNGSIMNVSPTEFAILSSLARAKGRVLSRAEIIERAWKEPSSVMKRTVDAHIKSLRSKLKHTGLNIVTIRRLGYSLRTSSGVPSAGAGSNDIDLDPFQSSRGDLLH